MSRKSREELNKELKALGREVFVEDVYMIVDRHKAWPKGLETMEEAALAGRKHHCRRIMQTMKAKKDAISGWVNVVIGKDKDDRPIHAYKQLKDLTTEEQNCLLASLMKVFARVRKQIDVVKQLRLPFDQKKTEKG